MREERSLMKTLPPVVHSLLDDMTVGTTRLSSKGFSMGGHIHNIDWSDIIHSSSDGVTHQYLTISESNMTMFAPFQFGREDNEE